MSPEQARAVFAPPGTVRLGGREFVIPKPTPGDAARVHERMRELAARACVSPLAYVNAAAADLAPGVLAEALRAAVAMGSGGGVEPTREAVTRAYDSLEGVRFQVWYYARKACPGLTPDEVAALVPEDARYDAADALLSALGLRDLDPNAPRPAGAS